MEAAPWIELLRESRDPADRFEAIDRLTRYPSREVAEAMVGCLEDPNYKLRAYALRALQQLTKMEIGSSAADWGEALRRWPVTP